MPTHSESMRNVAPPLQRSTPWPRLRAWLVNDELWEPTYRDIVSVMFWFCGPVFLAAAGVLIFGGS